MEPNAGAKLLALLFPILQVPGSNISSKIGFYGPSFFRGFP